MPRLPPSLVLRAACQGKYLPALLAECRDLRSAQNELRWLTEHASEVTKRHVPGLGHIKNQRTSSTELLSTYVKRRSRGEPLQYIIGNQPFGELEILCRRHVLIPRPETELYTAKLAHCLRETQAGRLDQDRNGLRILDVCTGSGCIALLLHSLIRLPNDSDACSEHSNFGLQIAGLDISRGAIKLAKDNKAHNIRRQSLAKDADCEVTFHNADVFDLLRHESSPAGNDGRLSNLTHEYLSTLVHCPPWRQDGSWDVVISNPPYISESDFDLGGTTTKSVRKYEPKLALVPPKDPNKVVDDGDIFYQHILLLALGQDARLIVMEVGGPQQALRISTLAQKLMREDGKEHCIELWRDDGNVKLVCTDEAVGESQSDTQPDDVVVRAVVIWRQDWSAWRRSRCP